MRWFADRAARGTNGWGIGLSGAFGRLLVLMAACVPAQALGAETTDRGAPRPNIVLILADDLGYGDLSSFGQTAFRTPNIDRLGAEGLTLRQFYAGSTVCAPSRCVLMTGFHTGHCYIRGNGDLNLRLEDVTIAEVLQHAGYNTALFGKWGLGHEGSTGVPTKQGFDEFFGYLDQRHAHNYYPTFLMDGEKRVLLENVVPNEDSKGAGKASRRVQYSADLILERTLAFLDRQEADGGKENTPFFLYYATTLPHANNEAGDEGMEIPDLGRFAAKDWPAPQKGLAAMVERLDSDVGAILEKLEKRGLAENTLVIFSSDNGPHSEGGNDAEFFDSNGPLRGIKRSPHEGGIRVPTLARWPGVIEAGRVTDQPGYFGDFFSTFAEVAGAPLPEGLDSHSLLPLFRGDAEAKAPEFLYWEFYERGSFQAVRMGKWKAVARPIGGKQVELYDLEADAQETRDVSEAHPEIVKEALALMAREHVPSPDWRIRQERRRQPQDP